MKKINYKNKQKGGFLIELMIGLVMSTLTVLAITTIYALFEKQKRTTVQLGQTMSNINLSMFPLQHRAKMAGYGISNATLLGCTVKAYNKNGERDFDFVLTPVKITPGASSIESDKVDFTHGNPQLNMMPVSLIANSNASNANIKVENKSGFNPGDLVILYEPGKNCNLVQVSGVQGNSDVLLRNTGNFTDPITGKKIDISYNKSGGLLGGEDYSTNAIALNIGTAPETIEFSIENNKLIEKNNLDLSTKEVGDNIVLLKAKYGLDMDDNGIVDSWTTDIGSNENYKFLKAIKIAMIARAPLIEQKSNGECKVTTNSQFIWGDEVLDIEGIVPDWGCYRYRFIQTVVPLRNMMWALDNT
jgi:type IV pilus assembly protein PilW